MHWKPYVPPPPKVSKIALKKGMSGIQVKDLILTHNRALGS